MKVLSGLIILSAAALAACGGASDAPARTTEALDDGVLRTQINATSKEDWVRFDLDDPESEGGDGWDLEFRRQFVGLHDSAGVELAIVDGKKLSQVDGTPEASEFFGDSGSDDDELAFSKESGWYSYSLLAHELKPRQRTYVVRSSEDMLYKLEFTTYYDSADDPGFPTFKWARLESDKILEREECVEDDKIAQVLAIQTNVSTAPANFSTNPKGHTTLELDASLGGTVGAAQTSFLYLDLESAALVPLSDADALLSKDWQLGIERSVIRVNSADSGPGDVAVLEVTGTTFEQAQPPALDAPGWRVDDFVSDSCKVDVLALDFIKTAFGQWYDYDFDSHAISIRKDTVHFVHDRERGELFAVQIVSYEDGEYVLKWRPVALP